MCEYINLRNKPRHSNVVQRWITRAGAHEVRMLQSQRMVLQREGDHSAPASSDKLTYTTTTYNLEKQKQRQTELCSLHVTAYCQFSLR